MEKKLTILLKLFFVLFIFLGISCTDQKQKLDIDVNELRNIKQDIEKTNETPSNISHDILHGDSLEGFIDLPPIYTARVSSTGLYDVYLDGKKMNDEIRKGKRKKGQMKTTK